jgi:predicted dehydrogenase
MKDKFGFGIIGCGNVSAAHAAAINELNDASLIAVCDIIPERAAALAQKYNCEYDTNIEAILCREDIDIICICTPSGLHSLHGKMAARAGKHVIVEKPIDVSKEAAQELIDVCHKEGVILSVISQHRFDDDIMKLKTAITEGRFGKLNFGAAHTKWYRSQKYYDSGAWRGTLKLDGGGALINQSIHYVDMLQYLMGPVVEVFGYTANRSHPAIEVEDVAVASVKFQNGALGLIEGNTAAFPGFYARLDIYGSDGSAVIVNDKLINWNLKCEGVTEADFGYTAKENSIQNTGAIKGWASTPGEWHNSHKRQLADVMAAIKEARSPLITGEEGLRTLAIVLGIYEASKSGKPVNLSLD